MNTLSRLPLLVKLVLFFALLFYVIGLTADNYSLPNTACSELPQAGEIQVNTGTGIAFARVNFGPRFCRPPVVVVAPVRDDTGAVHRVILERCLAGFFVLRLEGQPDRTVRLSWVAATRTQ